MLGVNDRENWVRGIRKVNAIFQNFSINLKLFPKKKFSFEKKKTLKIYSKKCSVVL